MSEYLVLRIDPDQPDRASWVVADGTGQGVSLTETGSYADAAHRAQQRPVIALVPGQQVLITRIALPVRGASRMLQAVPFALEEQLAEDVRHMHFALGKRDAAGLIAVSVVRSDLIEQWLSDLDAAGLNVSYLLPETAGIPSFEGVALVIDGPSLMIRDQDGKVLVGDTETAAEYLAALGIDEQTTVPVRLHVSARDMAHYPQTLSALRMTISQLQIDEVRDDVLPLMATAAIIDPSPNLLQGAYSRSSGNDKLWRPWRLAAMLAGAFILTALGGKALELLSLKSELAMLTGELNSIAAEVMPDSRLIDPLLQLEQLAASLRAGAGGVDADFLRMLDALSEALGGAGGTVLGKLDYRNGTMDLTLTAPDVDTLDRISRNIDARGLDAEIQSANQRDEAIEGRIRISGKKS